MIYSAAAIVRVDIAARAQTNTWSGRHSEYSRWHRPGSPDRANGWCRRDKWSRPAAWWRSWRRGNGRSDRIPRTGSTCLPYPEAQGTCRRLSKRCRKLDNTYRWRRSVQLHPPRSTSAGCHRDKAACRRSASSRPDHPGLSPSGSTLERPAWTGQGGTWHLTAAAEGNAHCQHLGTRLAVIAV